MKQARKDGLTFLQRLGTDAHFACNYCSVQDLTPKCMHWITVLGNVVIPSAQRTGEEIITARLRQFRARLCIVAWDMISLDRRSSWISKSWSGTRIGSIVPTNSRRPTLSLILRIGSPSSQRGRNPFLRWRQPEDLFIKT